MPSSKQRVDVWNGRRLKTSGGLTKDMLVKNKRGKLVSKKKSDQASEQNNLGTFLRDTGKTVPKDEMLHAKNAKKPKVEDASKKAAKVKAPPKPKAKAPKKAAAKLSVAKAAPKKVQVPKVKPKASPKPKQKKAAPKKKSNPKINPVTRQPYAKNSKFKVHIDNIKPGKRVRDIMDNVPQMEKYDPNTDPVFKW
jgi:hypothetical protein